MSHFCYWDQDRLGNGPLLQMLEVTTIGTAVTQAVNASSSSKTSPSSHGVRHSGLAASKLSWIHWEELVAPNSPDLNPLDYHIWATMLEKYHKLSQNPRRRVDTRTHQQGSGKLHQMLDCLRGFQWWSLRSSAVRVHFQVCSLISAPKTCLISDPPTYRRKRHSKCSKLVTIFPQVCSNIK